MTAPRIEHFISLGAGVQSSAMALMAAAGEIEPMPKAAIFADTGDEPASVYRWLDWLEKQLPFPVVRVTAGKISDDVLVIRVSKKTGLPYTRGIIPAFTLADDGSKGLLGRKCTADYKVRPIEKYLRASLPVRRGEKRLRVVQWIGISVDEAIRMKPSKHAWSKHRWPLIEKRVTRDGCKSWMKSNGYPEPPRSACRFCPFHSNEEWRRLRDHEPAEFAEAVRFEELLQRACRDGAKMSSTPYLHRSCTPLADVDLSDKHDPRQGDLFGNDCEGLCGV